jgi:hypothetical protein
MVPGCKCPSANTTDLATVGIGHLASLCAAVAHMERRSETTTAEAKGREGFYSSAYKPLALPPQRLPPQLLPRPLLPVPWPWPAPTLPLEAFVSEGYDADLAND